ncbi:mycothiol S-conjugate amidase [Actinoplanes lutulentus]|uniref:Mycothiol S-conjugate amidase n=1 Tax=Actinoplanes lutulentus TaxID=1287878 RepID=A0A327ZG43_9ACTN|nr:mycothiol conjugate amidase Mca [Actinoplanes lutulentus]MBB2945573.1 mycothiol S-conjugate amidase [Actinoplanes lutulentus]RAK40295.1 mycothiol S-conjugate amidase [Actinoplanes lutulentus]
MAEQLRLMTVHAHPDDESSKGAATMAKYVAEGVQVLVATCTGGERGSVLNPKMDRPEVLADIANIRRAEMVKAREILGVDQAWLGFVDSGLPEGDPLPPLPDGCFGLQDPHEAAKPLIKLIREFRPQVMTTYDENGGYPHPDHIMCHKVSVIAFDAAGDPGLYPELGEPWQPSKLYYNSGWTRARMLALHEGMLAAGLESPYTEWLEKASDRQDRGDKLTTRIECGDYFSIRDDALRAHATQVDPDGFWFKIPLELQQKVWPTEDFELARSLVDSPIPESDLFAGIREKVDAH